MWLDKRIQRTPKVYIIHHLRKNFHGTLYNTAADIFQSCGVSRPRHTLTKTFWLTLVTCNVE